MADTPPTASATATSTSTGTAAATVAAATHGILTTQPPGTPAAGGWKPDAGTPLWAAVLIGVLSASGVAIGAAVGQWNVLVGAAVGTVLVSTSISLAAYFGTRSAGPRS